MSGDSSLCRLRLSCSFLVLFLAMSPRFFCFSIRVVFLTQVHPRLEWRAAASDASRTLAPFLSTLSAHPGLYEHLSALLAASSTSTSTSACPSSADAASDGDAQPAVTLSAEARRVATTLLRDREPHGPGVGTTDHSDSGAGAAGEQRRGEIARLLQEVQAHTDAYMAATHGVTAAGTAAGRSASPDAGSVATDPDADVGADHPMPPPPPYLEIHSARARAALELLPADWRRSASLRGNGTVLRVPSRAAEALLRVLPCEVMRRQVYLAQHGPARVHTQTRALGRLFCARRRLAQALGERSFADLVQRRSAAGGAQNVLDLLTSTLETLRMRSRSGVAPVLHERSLAEKRALQLAKLAHSDDGSGSGVGAGAAVRARAALLRGASYASLPAPLQAEVGAVALRPWDQSFLIETARNDLMASKATGAGAGAGGAEEIEEDDPEHHDPSEYFSTGNVLRGMQLLLQRCFGIEARQVQPARQEDWTRWAEARAQDELLKLELWEPASRTHPPAAPGLPVLEGTTPEQQDKRLLGVIYLDLYARPHKINSIASFTVRSGRQNFGARDGDLGSTAAAAATPTRQVPVVGIVAPFARPAPQSQAIHPSQSSHSSGGVTLLTHVQAESLFHELGHCLHTILSATTFHSLSGARGTADCAELPSTLFERFLTAPEFVASWARHYATDAPISRRMLARMAEAKAAFAITELAAEARLSMFDQCVHGATGSLALGTNGESEGDHVDATVEEMQRLWSQLQSSYSPFELDDADADAASLAPFAHQTHLLSYGGSYYCYLYCHLLSAAVWDAHMRPDPLAPAVGDFLRGELFAPGGALDPVEVVRRVAAVPPEQSLHSFVQERLQLLLQQKLSGPPSATDPAAASAPPTTAAPVATSPSERR